MSTFQGLSRLRRNSWSSWSRTLQTEGIHLFLLLRVDDSHPIRSGACWLGHTHQWQMRTKKPKRKGWPLRSLSPSSPSGRDHQNYWPKTFCSYLLMIISRMTWNTHALRKTRKKLTCSKFTPTHLYVGSGPLEKPPYQCQVWPVNSTAEKPNAKAGNVLTSHFQSQGTGSPQYLPDDILRGVPWSCKCCFRWGAGIRDPETGPIPQAVK